MSPPAGGPAGRPGPAASGAGGGQAAPWHRRGAASTRAGGRAGGSGAGPPASGVGRAHSRTLRERGAIGAFVAVLAPVIIALIGLVYDGGLALEGRQRALDVAEQAARAAGNHCAVAMLRSQSECLITDHAGARAIAASYLNPASGISLADFRVIDGDHTVVVQTRVRVKTLFLGLFGVGEFDILMAPRSATAVTGLA